MSNRHYHDDFSEIDEDTLRMLGSRFGRLATTTDDRLTVRRRWLDSDAERRESTRPPKRVRQRIN